MTIGTVRKSDRWARYVTGIRQRLHCNQREFSELAGVSAAYICRIEKHGWTPSFQTCELMAENLRIDKWELLRQAGYVPAERKTS